MAYTVNKGTRAKINQALPLHICGNLKLLCGKRKKTKECKCPDCPHCVHIADANSSMKQVLYAYYKA